MNVLKTVAGTTQVKHLSPEDLKKALECTERVSPELRHALLTQRLLCHKYGIK